MFTMSNFFSGLFSLILGSIVSWMIAKRVSSRSCLIFSLDRCFYIKASDISKKFSISVDGKMLKNLYVAKLSIKLRGANDLSAKDVSSGNKPMLQFDKLKIFDVRTINNDSSLFDIPLGLVGESKLIININHFKRNSHADFYIIASSEGGEDDMYIANFFPGFISGVDEKTTGLISPDRLKRG